MRGAWVVLAGAALAGLLWWVLGASAGEAAPPAAGRAPDATAPPPADPLVAERRSVRQPREDPGASRVAEPETGEADVPPPAADMGRIRLRVLDTVSNEPVPAFRCVFTAGDLQRRLEAPGGEGFLDVPFDLSGDLLIEAQGYTPESRAGFSLTPSEPEIPLTVYLNPVAPFSGIEIDATDDRGAPVAHLQVAAWRSDDPDRPLWIRQSSDQAGHYELPDLQPASYRLELAAVDENGERLPSLTHTETVQFGGSERIPLRVRFRPGSLLTLSVLDPTDEPRGAEVVLRLVYPDGHARPARWRSRIDGEVVERLDGLPAAAPATLSEPVPPGGYQLVLQLPTGAQRTVPLLLLPDQHDHLTIRL